MFTPESVLKEAISRRYIYIYQRFKIKFRFVSGSSELTDVEFRSVKIFDTNGQLKKVVRASVDEYFTLDDLATGTYILNVELFNYQICSRIFTLM